MTIPCISREELQNEAKLAKLLDDSFQEVVSLSKESLSWPVLYRHRNIVTRRKEKAKNEQHAYLQRYSTHTEVTYDELRRMLYLDHSINETKYVDQLAEADLIEALGNGSNVFRLGFKTPPLSKNREFIELVATRESDRSFMVVSQPVEVLSPPKKGFVRGAYQAWEIVTEKQNENGDNYVEWVCIQRSSAGGSIPSIISDYVAAKDFHHDVVSLVKYIQNNK